MICCLGITSACEHFFVSFPHNFFPQRGKTKLNFSPAKHSLPACNKWPKIVQTVDQAKILSLEYIMQEALTVGY